MTRPGKNRKNDRDIVIGQKHSMRSRLLKEKRAYWVYLPHSYAGGNQEQRYPVLYLLDGDAYFQADSGVVHFMSSGISGNCQIPEMIVVAIPNTDRTRDLTPTHTALGYSGQEEDFLDSSGGGDAFLQFMNDELFPRIDSQFRTLPSRILAGHSFGGLLTIHALLHQPDMFQAYIAMDPSLWWDGEILTRRADGKIKSLRKLRKSLYISSANTPSIAGSSPHRMRRAIRRFGQTLGPAQSASFRVRLQHFADEDHASVPLLSLYHGLMHIFDGFKIADVETLPAMKVRLGRLSKRLGGDVLPTEGYANLMGYAMLYALKDIRKALAFFEYNISRFPKSANAWDSLAEAYMTKGDTAQAIEYYEKSLKLDPDNQNAILRLRKLKGEPAVV